MHRVRAWSCLLLRKRGLAELLPHATVTRLYCLLILADLLVEQLAPMAAQLVLLLRGNLRHVQSRLLHKLRVVLNRRELVRLY